MTDRMKKVFGDKFGEKVRLEEVTPEMVEGFRDALVAEDLSDRTVNKYLTVLHGLFVWAHRRYKLPANPVASVERRPHAKRGNIDVFSREEVLALVRAAASKQDGTVYLTAAFTGLRLGELLALRWRDVDFVNSAIHVRQSFTNGRVDTPKSGQERTVPMADEVAQALASLGRRDDFRRRRRSRLLRSQGRPPRRAQAPRPLQGGAEKGRTPRAALPRPPPHLRLPRDPHRRLPRGHGVDGPSGLGDDPALPSVQAETGRGTANLRRFHRHRRAGPGREVGLTPVAVLADPPGEVGPGEPKPPPPDPHMGQPPRTHQLVKRAAWHMEQSRRLVGIEQRFGEELGVGHRFSALYVQETGRMPRLLNSFRVDRHKALAAK